MIQEAYILAGGKSSRMGEDKGLKNIGHKPMIESVIQQLKKNFSVVKINTQNIDYKIFELQLIPDIIQDKGPLGGIYTALNDSGGDIFVASCDIPLISSESIQYILKHHKKGKVTVASYKGNIHPLFGIYTQEIVPKLKKKIENNKLKMRSFIEEVEADIVEMSINFPTDFLANINTPEEIRSVEKLIKHEY